jgi:hypothetical protein
MSQLMSIGIPVWHANFEPINSLSFFKNGDWKDWILKVDTEKVKMNYQKVFSNATEVYEQVGFGFSKRNFLSRRNLQYLIRNLTNILSNKSLKTNGRFFN